ncbi:EamA family transporter [Patescibacteria group bacterium]|nr:EamA family transporter [Patescibacteria group bacterium]
MFWFFLAIIGYLLLALVAILDKFILTKSLNKPAVYTFYSTIFMFGALVLWPFGAGWIYGIDWFWAIVSGLGFGFGLWTFYKAVKEGEATHIVPFNGAVIMVATYIFSSWFLNENLSGVQLTGVAILVFASILLTWEKSLKHQGFHSGFIWAIASGLFFAISHVSAKYLYEIYPFLTGFMWTRVMTGFLGLFLLTFPAVRKSFIRRKKKAKTVGKRHALLIVVINKILSVGSLILIQFAAAIGSVTLVMALAGVQYVLIFIFVYLSTKLFKKFFQEYFTKREIAVQLVALVWLR